MDRDEILALFAEVGAIIKDSHIVYTSGQHGSAYINKDAIYPYTEKISMLCKVIAEEFASSGAQVVVAPALGGIILSQWITHHLTQITSGDVLAVYAEKTADGGFVIKRGYDKIIANKQVLVVEDVLTTGGSAKKVIEEVRKCGGEVVGLGVLCNRGGITPEDVANPPRLFSLVDVDFETFKADDCPFCKKGIPINTDVGKGREFLEKKKSS